jgi:hypothetical protein
MTVVGSVGGTIIVVGFGKNEDVVATTEGVFEDCSRTKVDVRITGGGLISRRAVKVPDAKLANIGDLLADGLDTGSVA